MHTHVSLFRLFPCADSSSEDYNVGDLCRFQNVSLCSLALFWARYGEPAAGSPPLT